MKLDLDAIEAGARKAQGGVVVERFAEDCSPDVVLVLVRIAKSAARAAADIRSDTPDGGASQYELLRAVDALDGDEFEELEKAVQPKQEAARRALEALAVLSEVGLEHLDELEPRVMVGMEGGAVLFNNEYEIADGDLVNTALVLLAYARKLRKL